MSSLSPATLISNIMNLTVINKRKFFFLSTVLLYFLRPNIAQLMIAYRCFGELTSTD